MKSIRNLLTRIRSKSPPLEVDDHLPQPEQRIAKDLKPVLQKLKSSSKLCDTDPIGSLGLQLVKFYQTDLPMPFAISPSSVMGVFLPLHMASSGDTQLLFNKYFNEKDSEVTFDHFLTLNGIMRASGNLMTSYHLVHNPKLIITQKFSDRIKSIYSITPFSNRSNEQATREINTLIKTASKDHIDRIINLIDSTDSLIFLTTVYFKAKWLTPFNPSLTVEAEFAGAYTSSIAMMKQLGNCHMYTENSDYQLLEMNYQGYHHTMGILLPRKVSPKLRIDGLTSEKLLNLIHELKETTIAELQVPKFRVEHEFDLAPFCYVTGLGQIFQDADLPGCCANHCEATVSRFIQKAIVETDELGTGLSSAVVKPRHATESASSSIKAKSQPSLIANHSFLFYIRHRETNTLVMMGIYR